MSAAPETPRYSAVAILLHWAIAAAILLNAAIGWTMKGSFGAFQLHKSIGLTVLLLSVARLGWRLMNPPPPPPAAMPAWEKAIAQTTHRAFYALMLAIPLAGWVFVSTQWHDGRPLIVQTVYFGLFPVPNLFGLDGAPEAARASISDASALAHKLLVWSMLALLALHAAAALKHHFADRDDVLTRMVPGLAKSAAQPRRRAALAIGFTAIAGALVWAVAARVTMPSAAPIAPAAQSAIVAEEEPAAAASSPVVAEPAPAAAKAKQAPPQPPLWAIDMEASAINFTASLTGAPARGRFARWSGEIHADPADFSTAQARFVVETGSASIGVPELQQSLVAAEGFDPANHPQATFVLSRFARTGDGYTAQGALTVKGRTARVAIPVTLTIEGGRARASARFTLQRDVFDLGMESDPAFEFIGRDVIVDVTIAAAR